MTLGILYINIYSAVRLIWHTALSQAVLHFDPTRCQRLASKPFPVFKAYRPPKTCLGQKLAVRGAVFRLGCAFSAALVRRSSSPSSSGMKIML